MFNFSGSEIIFLLLLALIILGPEKLPDAVRKFGKGYAEFKKVTTGFQQELKSALDEPMREMRETAEAFKNAATFDIPKFDLEPTATGELQPDPKAAPPAIAANGNEPPIAPAEPTVATSEAQPITSPEPSPAGDDLGASAG